MVSAKTQIINPLGLHMRPAQIFVAAMMEYPCAVSILFNEKKINAKSIMRVMGAAIKQGSEIEIVCDGEQEEEALKKAVELIESGLGELEPQA